MPQMKYLAFSAWHSEESTWLL